MWRLIFYKYSREENEIMKIVNIINKIKIVQHKIAIAEVEYIITANEENSDSYNIKKTKLIRVN